MHRGGCSLCLPEPTKKKKIWGLRTSASPSDLNFFSCFDEIEIEKNKFVLLLRKACKNSRSLANPFWEKSMWKKEKKKNNAKFSGHYVCPHMHNVHARALHSHQKKEERIMPSLVATTSASAWTTFGPIIITASMRLSWNLSTSAKVYLHGPVTFSNKITLFTI